MNKSGSKTLSLVLGSGGARGLAHIGIIRELEDAGYEIRAISGASIGALVGGAFATGKLDEFEKWVRAINRVNILGLMDINWGAGGLLKGDRIRETVTHMFGEWKIEDLPIKFTAVAADIVKEKEVWISSGPLYDAMRASISLPLFMTPLRRSGAILVDGGVLNPVPIGPTLNDETDMTIAVNLGGIPEASSRPEKHGERNRGNGDDAILPFADKIRGFLDSMGVGKTGGESKDEKLPDMINVADRTFDVMQNAIARQKLAANPPDHLIEIPRNACGIMDFDRASDMIELGRQKACEMIAQMKSG